MKRLQKRILTSLVKLYPKTWQLRYREEFLALLEDYPFSLGIIFNVIAGALKAQLRHKTKLLWDDKVEIFERFGLTCLIGVLTVVPIWLGSRTLIQILLDLADNSVMSSTTSLISKRVVSLSINDYFFSTVYLAFYGEMLFASPLAAFLIIDFFNKKRSQIARKESAKPIAESKSEPAPKGEKRSLFPLLTIPVLTACWIFGIAFSYFVTFPAAIRYFFAPEPVISSLHFVAILGKLACLTGLCFEIPGFIFFLATSKLVSWKVMLRWWVRALFASIVIAAIMVPSFEPLIVAIASLLIFGLYWLGIAAARFGANKFKAALGEVSSN